MKNDSNKINCLEEVQNTTNIQCILQDINVYTRHFIKHKYTLNVRVSHTHLIFRKLRRPLHENSQWTAQFDLNKKVTGVTRTHARTRTHAHTHTRTPEDI